MKQTISILGSTGSVGLSTLKIIDKKKNLFKIEILSANKNFKMNYQNNSSEQFFTPDYYSSNIKKHKRNKNQIDG